MLTPLVLAAVTLLPPIGVSVQAGPDIPRALVMMALEETSAVWSVAGVTFVWQVAEVAAPQMSHTNVMIDSARQGCVHCLCVTIGEETGPERGSGLPIGWIVFDDEGTPTSDIHLSYHNALALVRAAEGAGTVSRMTVMELRTLMSRVLGRALAHELGHYLLRSKEHTATGLMKARLTAAEFLGTQRGDFEIDPALKARISARLRLTDNVAER